MNNLIPKAFLFPADLKRKCSCLRSRNITNPEKAYLNCKAGADIIVVGNAIEKDESLIMEIASAVHSVPAKMVGQLTTVSLLGLSSLVHDLAIVWAVRCKSGTKANTQNLRRAFRFIPQSLSNRRSIKQKKSHIRRILNTCEYRIFTFLI